MYAILGEKNVRTIDGSREGNFISYHDFFKNRNENYKIIIDRSDVDFSLEGIRNCRIVDAYSALRCKKKVEKASEYSFVVSKNKYNVFQKNDFYIQTNAINDAEILNKISNQNSIFLMEHIISEFCRNVVIINDDTWWMYVAEHISSGVKIVVGFGMGIVVSRILPLGADISKNILQTIQYVRRQGFESNMKIISLMTDIQVNGFDVMTLDIEKIADKLKLKNQKDVELFLVNFAATNNRIPILFCSDNPFYMFVSKYVKKINVFLSLCISVCILTFCVLEYKISNIDRFMKSVENFPMITAEDSSKTFKAQLHEESFVYIQEIVNLLKNTENPLMLFSEISKIFHEIGISPNEIHMENQKIVNIFCVLNEKQMENLLKLSNDVMQIVVTKTNSLQGEYEKIGKKSSQNFGVKICIKIN